MGSSIAPLDMTLSELEILKSKSQSLKDYIL